MQISLKFRYQFLQQRFFTLGDAIVLLLIATAIVAIVSFGHQWSGEFHPTTAIDLSIWALPKYTLLSAARGAIAYALSLGFTFVVGYLGAKSPLGERIIVPALDVLQTIPVLGFLPGLVLGLIALFPHTNVGLEMAAILMIFTSQVWNMTFSFYSSLKSIPPDFTEASTIMGLNWFERLLRLELPFSAVNLVWNSLLSMAGGWFFLTVCEAFTLGDLEFRLPGIGSYMAVAIREGNLPAMGMGVLAMTTLIVTMDFFFWRPVLAWVQRYRTEEVSGAEETEPLMQIVIRESRLVDFLKSTGRRYRLWFRQRRLELERRFPQPAPLASLAEDDRAAAHVRLQVFRAQRARWLTRALEGVFLVVTLAFLAWGGYKLFALVATLSSMQWMVLLRNTFWTFLRVMLAVALSTLWAVPFGIWVGTSPKRIRVAQPLIQVLASFPAPMLYPLALMGLFKLGFNFDWSSMVLMMLGVQWYVLFNALAGALRIPRELDYALKLMEVPRWERWKRLYLPSVFPSLVTGWVMAAGGAWNASIVAEYMVFEGKLYETGGLGSSLTVAAANKDFRMLAASLMLMVLFVIAFNRLVWAPIYKKAQTRYRMDL